MSNVILLIMKMLIEIIFVCIIVSTSSSYHVHGSTIKECNCHCSKVFKNEMSVCKNLFELKEQVYHVTSEIEKRTRHIGDLSDLMERVGLHELEFKKVQKVVEGLKNPTETIHARPTQEAIAATTDRNILEDVEKQTEHSKEIKELKERLDSQEVLYKNILKVVEDLQKTKDGSLPKPQSLVSPIDDNMLGDSSLDSRLADGSELLAKNMFDLLAKVEVVENLTSKVQEELKSERRVRRHLEEDLNETRTSIKLLNDKLVNVSLPMENRNDLVEEITLLTLENINKTLLEEQLQKLYYHLAYMNETKYLYEHMDEVKDTFLNLSSGNVLLFEEELRSLSDTVKSLTENVTVELTLKEIRLNALEAKNNETEDLDEQLNLLMNASDLIHGGIEEMWKDVQEIKNDTVNMKKNMYEQIREIDNFTESAIKEMSEKFENITLEMSDMKKVMVEGKEPISAINHELALMARDLKNVENRVDLLGTLTDNKLKDIAVKVKNATEVWNASIAAITEQIIRDNRMEKLIMDPTPTCALPDVKDDHLLITLKNDSSGQLTMEFGCRPIGKYILNSNPTVLSCINGMWNGPVPACIRLLDEKEVDNIEEDLRNQNPCMYSFGNIPDTVDCTYYFQCTPGSTRRMKCPPGHHFSRISKICEPAYTALCQTDRDKLTDLIPPILIDPDNVDKPYGLMGTGPRGELIVHPRTTFFLHCLFPSSAWDPPSWRFMPGFSTARGEPSVGLDTRHESLHSSRLGPNRYAVSITGASSRDSGVYMCVSPRGKFNMIEVIVKSVHCPLIASVDEEPINAYYRPHPEGENRILSTPVEFQCRGGFSITAICKADGTWSRPVPTREECIQENSVWGCPPIDTSSRPNLILERDDRDSILNFRCTNSRLIGNAFSRCLNGTWTHTTLPRCASIFP